MSFDVGLVGKPPSDRRSDEDREPSVRSPSVGKSTFFNATVRASL
ncbi:hypothetical protein [Halomicrobium katesii]|nr:hypothetical protein [Halomicrobium katesii]